MALNYNGNRIGKVVYNGKPVNKLIYNGNVVFTANSGKAKATFKNTGGTGYTLKLEWLQEANNTKKASVRLQVGDKAPIEIISIQPKGAPLTITKDLIQQFPGTQFDKYRFYWVDGNKEETIFSGIVNSGVKDGSNIYLY